MTAREKRPAKPAAPRAPRKARPTFGEPRAATPVSRESESKGVGWVFRTEDATAAEPVATPVTTPVTAVATPAPAPVKVVPVKPVAIPAPVAVAATPAKSAPVPAPAMSTTPVARVTPAASRSLIAQGLDVLLIPVSIVLVTAMAPLSWLSGQRGRR